MTMADPQFDGVYGLYTITDDDRLEVQRYRLALLACGVSMSAGLLQWWLIGGSWAWLWLLPLTLGLGLALQWIHIYLKPLHQALKLLLLLGCIGWLALLVTSGPRHALSSLASQPLWILAVGPQFAALTGIGFKEFFCFQRLEAIGLTLLLPIALLGRLTTLMGSELCLALMGLASLLLVVMALRKFGIDAAADVGDKSVFAYLEGQLASGAP